MKRNIEPPADRQEGKSRNLLSIALGGGALYAIAYQSGICQGLANAGIDVSRAEFIGTSGGVWTAGFIKTGKAQHEVEAMPNVVFPNRQRGYLQQMGREAFGDMRAPQVRATGVRLPSLRHPIPETKVFRGDEYDLADMAALSSAIPLGFHPVEVDGENYVDGGARSLVHAHRAPAADNLLVIAPLARHFNPKLKGVKLHAGRALEIMTLREMEQWETEHGGLASLIRPNREIGGLVEKFSDIFSRKVARKAHDLAVKQGEQLATNRHTLATLAFRMSLPERDAS